MKEYLGDSVYADFQNNGVVLTTENGMGASNTIYMEPQVLVALNGFYRRATALPEPTKRPLALDSIEYTRNNLERVERAIKTLGAMLDDYDGEANFVVCGDSLDFDNRPHEQVIAIMSHLKAGKWEKNVGFDGKSVDYTNKTLVPGWTVRFWGAAPPPNCKLVEEEVDVPEVPAVPATKKKVWKMVCKETVTPETMPV